LAAVSIVQTDCWGGNSTTRYNRRGPAHNAGSDYFFLGYGNDQTDDADGHRLCKCGSGAGPADVADDRPGRKVRRCAERRHWMNAAGAYPFRDYGRHNIVLLTNKDTSSHSVALTFAQSQGTGCALCQFDATHAVHPDSYLQRGLDVDAGRAAGDVGEPAGAAGQRRLVPQWLRIATRVTE